MKIFIWLLSLLCAGVPSMASAQKLALSVNAQAAILMNADSGVILYEKNAHDLHYPASITKIATAAYVLQKASDKLDVMIAADQDSIGTVKEETLRRSNYTLPAYLLIPDASHIGIKKDEELSLRDLLYGLMLSSGDDAANVIAKYVGGTIPQFMEELNAYVKQLGCSSTTFYNPHGLHHPQQKTTAYDMALLTREAMRDSLFRQIVSTVRYARPKTNKQDSSMMVQTNKLLRAGPYYYEKAIGVKTGSYSLAGSTLVAAAKDGDRTLIAVLLKGDRKERFVDAKKMFEAAFSQPKVQRILLHGGPQKFSVMLPNARKALTTYINEDVSVEYYPAEEQEVRCVLLWDRHLRLPIKRGQRVGELVVQLEDQQVGRKVPLYAQEDVKATLVGRIQQFLSSRGERGRLLKAVAALVVILSIGLALLLFLKKQRQK